VLWNKLAAGGFRPGVKAAVVIRALAVAVGREETELARGLAAGWTPSAASFAALLGRHAPAGGEHGEWAGSGLGALALAAPPQVEGDDGGGREEGDVELHTVAAVLLYAQRGDGGRGSHYTDLTLAAWDDGALVPVAKVESGLAPAERTELDRWVRRHIVERFGPVRQVRPELVFEVAFEGVETSGRHKAGLVLRAPRLVRWLRDRAPAEAASLAALCALLPARRD
jgi:hypothetical protein